MKNGTNTHTKRKGLNLAMKSVQKSKKVKKQKKLKVKDGKIEFATNDNNNNAYEKDIKDLLNKNEMDLLNVDGKGYCCVLVVMQSYFQRK